MIENQETKLMLPKESANSIECVRTRINDKLSPESLFQWFRKRRDLGGEPFYSSIDIRDAGFKIAPVDANLFPAGFNNICSTDRESASALLELVLREHIGKIPKHVAIITEAHTRNRYYADNLKALKEIFETLGTQVGFAWTGDGLADGASIELECTDGTKLSAWNFSVDERLFSLKTKEGPFVPEFILLNNDFSSGFPERLRDVKQPIEPSLELGWHTRRKSDFFKYYNEVAQAFAQTLALDPWHLTVHTELVEGVNFEEEESLKRVASSVDLALKQIRSNYQSRGICETPYVFVKSNAGTYGMGILAVRDPEEILSMNRREKNKMSVGKNNLKISEVIVQEGIPTRFRLEGTYAEPVIYSLGHELMGGFLRKNPNRGSNDNLNSNGMVFSKLCLSDLREFSDRDPLRDLSLELVYGAIASLSVIALSQEAKNIRSQFN